jgi:hypothetical protein
MPYYAPAWPRLARSACEIGQLGDDVAAVGRGADLFSMSRARPSTPMSITMVRAAESFRRLIGPPDPGDEKPRAACPGFSVGSTTGS